jgi:hypothetical protein
MKQAQDDISKYFAIFSFKNVMPKDLEGGKERDRERQLRESHIFIHHKSKIK